VENEVRSILTSNGNVLVLTYTDGQRQLKKILKSTDEGYSWFDSFLGIDSIDLVAGSNGTFAVDQSGAIYCMFPQKLYVSLDDGATWKLRSLPFIAVTEMNILAFGVNRLFCWDFLGNNHVSTDGGFSWQNA